MLKMLDISGGAGLGLGVYFGLRSLGISVKDGLRNMMAGRGSGVDHLEAGLQKVGQELAKQPLQVHATVHMK